MRPWGGAATPTFSTIAGHAGGRMMRRLIHAILRLLDYDDKRMERYYKRWR
jgi:hypothetical protein